MTEAGAIQIENRKECTILLMLALMLKIYPVLQRKYRDQSYDYGEKVMAC